MSPKLIFFDIDGTLAMPGHEVSQEVKEALKKVGIDPGIRAENLSNKDFANITQSLFT